MYTAGRLSEEACIAWGFGRYSNAWKVSGPAGDFVIRKGDGTGTPGKGLRYSSPLDRSPVPVDLFEYNINIPDTTN